MKRDEFLSRRKLVQYAGVVAAGACGGCGGPGGTEQPTGPVAAGNVSALSVGALRIVEFVVIGRDAGGVYAMSNICTHAGCPMEAAGTQLACGCHGSIFDRNGEVVRGPARRPLPHFRVDVATDGTMTVQQDAVVDASARTPVT